MASYKAGDLLGQFTDENKPQQTNNIAGVNKPAGVTDSMALNVPGAGFANNSANMNLGDGEAPEGGGEQPETGGNMFDGANDSNIAGSGGGWLPGGNQQGSQGPMGQVPQVDQDVNKSQEPTNQTSGDTSKYDTDGYATPGYVPKNVGNAPPGYDPAKWADPNHQTPKYVVGRILSSNGDLKDPANRNKAIEDIKLAYPGTQFNGKDKISIDGGKSWVDIFGGAGAGIFSIAWQPDNAGDAPGPGLQAPDLHTGSMAPVAGAGGAASAGGATANPSANSSVDPFAAMGGGVQLPGGEWVPKDHPLASQGKPGGNNPDLVKPAGSPGSGEESDVDAALRNPKDALMRQLMERMRQSEHVDRNDPAVRGQADAYSANEERARRQYLSETAEGKSPYSTGAMRGEQRMSAERMGQRVGGFEADLVGRELTSKRQEIQQSLDSMGTMLTEQERQGLQRELAQLDASIKRQSIDTQNSQFYAGLGQADRQFLAQLSQQGRFAEMDDAFRRMQLGQNDTQWRDKMGFDEKQQQNEWDWKQRGNA